MALLAAVNRSISDRSRAPQPLLRGLLIGRKADFESVNVGSCPTPASIIILGVVEGNIMRRQTVNQV